MAGMAVGVTVGAGVSVGAGVPVAVGVLVRICVGILVGAGVSVGLHANRTKLEINNKLDKSLNPIFNVSPLFLNSKSLTQP